MTEQVPEQISHELGPTRRGPRAGLITVGAATVVAAVVVAIAFAANNADSPSGDKHRNIGGAPGGKSGELIGRGTVLDDGTNGPQLCLGGIMESYPPQCSGPDVLNWDWDKVTGFDHANGVRWGEFVVIGTYDSGAGTFTLTRPAVRGPEYDGAGLPSSGVVTPEFQTPCPAPSGGWRVVDPALTTQASLDETLRQAQARSDFAGAWVDQSINPAMDGGVTPGNEGELNDPSQLVLNIAVTGDLRAAELELRQTWGGALCISQAQHTERELQQIQSDLSSESGLLYSNAGNDHVEATVIWDDGSLQQRLDQRYGSGTVVVTSALQPFES